ncbi:MAG: hypothetical protein HYZ53_26395 [Planctomycetes bacterium]|nr:hypothetical protein [Planctomycetota bacterium]
MFPSGGSLSGTSGKLTDGLAGLGEALAEVSFVPPVEELPEWPPQPHEPGHLNRKQRETVTVMVSMFAIAGAAGRRRFMRR